MSVVDDRPDELDVGRDPRWVPPWRGWSRRLRVVVGVLLAVVVVVAAVLTVTLRPSSPAPAARPVPTPNLARAPGADATIAVSPDPTKCPPAARCTTASTVSAGLERSMRAAFPSIGYIGRTCTSDLDSGRVYWQYVHFTTGTLVSVTLTQEPVELLGGPPPPDHLAPSARDIDGGSLTLTDVRGGYLMTAQVAGLPGQSLPVDSARRWLETVQAP